MKPHRTRFAWLGLEALVGCSILQVVLALPIALGHRWSYEAWPSWPLGVYFVGFGLGLAVTLTVVQALWARRAWAGGIAAVLFAPLPLLGGEALLALAVVRRPLEAIALLGETLGTASLSAWLLGASGLFVVVTALAAVRVRGWSVADQSWTALAAACLWGAPVLALATPEHFPLAFHLLLVPVQAAALPFALALGAVAAGKAFAWIGQAPDVETTSSGGPADPTARHRARRLAKEGEAHAAAGRHDEAGRALKEAFEAWPTRQRGLLAAWSLTQAGEPFQAIDLLVAADFTAEELADDPVLEPLRGLPEWSKLAAEEQETGALWLTDCVRKLALTCLVPTSVVAVVAVAHVDEPAAATVLRMRASVLGGAAWRTVAERLERKYVSEPVLVGPTAAFARVDGLPKPPLERRRARIEQALRRGAEGGDPVAMRRFAAVLEEVGVGMERPHAIRWYRAAAEAGDVPAMRRLAEILRTGWGGAAVDPAEAARWRAKADASP